MFRRKRIHGLPWPRVPYHRMVLLFWTWVFYRLFVRFDPSHPWGKKERPFTLEEWARGATPLLREFAVLFWFTAIGALSFLLTILHHLFTCRGC